MKQYSKIVFIICIIAIITAMTAHGARIKNGSFEIYGKESYESGYWSTFGPALIREKKPDIALHGKWVTSFDLSSIGQSWTVSGLWQDVHGLKKGKRIKVSTWIYIDGPSQEALTRAEVELKIEGEFDGFRRVVTLKKFPPQSLPFKQWYRLEMVGHVINPTMRFLLIFVTFGQEEPRVGKYYFDGISYEYLDGRGRAVVYKPKDKSKDKSKNKSKELFVEETEVELKMKTYKVKIEDILFDFDKFSLTPTASKRLDDFSKTILDQYPSNDVWINGYADHRGSSDYNKKLSQNRAMTVDNYLKSKGNLKQNKVEIIGHGELESISTVEVSEEAMQKDRKVEVIVKVQEIIKQTNKIVKLKEKKDKKKRIPLKAHWVRRSKTIQNLDYNILPEGELLLVNFDAKSISRKVANADYYSGGNSQASIGYHTNETGGTFLRLSYFLGPKVWWRYANVELIFPAPIDARKYTHLRFGMKGSGYPVRVKLLLFNFEGYDYHGFTVGDTSKEWKEYSIAFEDFRQEGFGTIQPLELTIVKGVQFQTASGREGESGWFDIDDIYFVNANHSSELKEKVGLK